MRVMVNACSYTSIIMLALLDEINDTFLVHNIQFTHQVHSCETPVDPIHSKVLSHAEFIIIFVSSISCYKTGMFRKLQTWNVVLFRQDNIIG